MEDQLRNMEIHEQISVDIKKVNGMEITNPNQSLEGITVTRVVGGWIYNIYRLDRGSIINTVFVPER